MPKNQPGAPKQQEIIYCFCDNMVFVSFVFFICYISFIQFNKIYIRLKSMCISVQICILCDYFPGVFFDAIYFAPRIALMR